MDLDSLIVGATLVVAVVLLVRHFRKQWKNGGRCEGCGRSCVGCSIFAEEKAENSETGSGETGPDADTQ
jgi:hypothetical protein